MDIQSVKQRFGIIGNNQQLNSAIEIALRVAPTDLSVLITGESGVGKEFFPQIIHNYSARKHNNYIAVNCGAIPEGTIDSELFGHEKGAFTGATESRKGYFEMADGGTIFLDEVAELPQTTQVRLLRMLQSGEFIRVGSSKVQKTNVRVVAATNINLVQAVRDGQFREDLYYRLNIVPITLPPLRERKADIHLLFRKFCTDIAAQYRMPVIQLTPEAREILERYRWPGNIRQLKNVAEQISVVEESREIDTDTLNKYLPRAGEAGSPMVIGSDERGAYSAGSDRELLFTVLYDIRKDILELKRMVAALQGGKPADPLSQLSLPAHPEPQVLPYRAEEKTLPEEEVETVEAEEEPEVLSKEEYQREAILRALAKHKGKRKEAAKELFISERTLYRRIKELGIED